MHDDTLQTDFDAILDRCISDIAEGRATMAICLALYPEHAARLRLLLRVAEQVEQIPPLPPLSDEKRRAIGVRVFERVDQSRAAARQLNRQTVRRRPFWRRSLAFVAVMLAVCLIAGVTAVTSSASSLPGEVLYPVKRLAEQAAVALTPLTGQAVLQVDLAQRRLAEFATLARRGDVRPELLTEISVATNLALKDSESLPASQQQTVLNDLARFSELQLAVLVNVSAGASDATRVKLQESMANTAATRDKARGVLSHTTQPGSDGKEDHGNPAPAATGAAGTEPANSTQNTPEAPPTPPEQATPNAGPIPPGQATPNPEPIPPGQATPEPGHTPPGQAKPKREPTPPGQAPPKPKHTPPGQATPNVGPTPQGQNPPKPKHTPPGKGNPNHP